MASKPMVSVTSRMWMTDGANALAMPERMPKPRQNPVRKPKLSPPRPARPAPEQTRRVAASPKASYALSPARAFVLVLGLLMAFGVFSFIVSRDAKIAGNNVQIQKLKQEIATLQDNNKRVALSVRGGLDLNGMMDKAQKMGMGYPQDASVIQVQTSTMPTTLYVGQKAGD